MPHTINVLRKRKDQIIEIVPMIAKLDSSEKQDATLQRMRHPVELGFCCTFHKIQGQTVECIILALHPRSSCQLLSMSFEMLYVALTRVRSAEDIRIMSCPIKGLQHLRNLKRPACFDAWLKAYTEHGDWDSSELSRQAEDDKRKVMGILRSSRPLAKYTIKMMKTLLPSLGIQPKNAPGKNYPRQRQYRDALYPVWVEANLSRSKAKRSRYLCTTTTKATSSGDATVEPTETQIKPTTPQPSSNRTTVTPTNHGRRGHRRRPRLRVTLRSFTPAEKQIIQQSRRTLRSLRRTSRNDQQLRFRAWAKDVPSVGYISRRSACAWSQPGLMMSDTALYSVALHLLHGSRCHFVDPLLVAHQDVLEGSLDPNLNLLDLLHNDRVLALPYNDPDKHWWMVFALLASDNKTLQLTHRNSCAAWDGAADASIRSTISLMKRLLQSTQYNVNKHEPFTYKVIPSVDPIRQRQTNSCGIHCCAHSLLAARGQIFQNHRLFDTNFIDNLRDRALMYYDQYRVNNTRVIVIRDGDDGMRRGSTSSIKPSKRGTPTAEIHDSPKPKRARKGLFRDLTVHREYISAIRLGVKTIECRPNMDKYNNWKIGDVIRFNPAGGSRRGDLPCVKSIMRLTPYPNFRCMLQKESVSVCLPGVTSVNDAVNKYRSFHKSYPQLEKDLGVIAFELGPWQGSNRQ